MTARRVAYVLVALVLLYVAFIGWRGVVLIADGRPAFVLLGLGVLLLPVVGVVLVWRELRLGFVAQELGRVLEAEGGLPSDPLPRRPSGRADLAAADVVFDRRRAEVEAAPDDWRAWYRLAVAYGDAGDTRRGREALRQAITRYRATP
ncbi:MAG: tetratricopeptide repeat protein [Candidatus Nanopelagicales bacterium]